MAEAHPGKLPGNGVVRGNFRLVRQEIPQPDQGAHRRVKGPGGLPIEKLIPGEKVHEQRRNRRLLSRPTLPAKPGELGVGVVHIQGGLHLQGPLLHALYQRAAVGIGENAHRAEGVIGHKGAGVLLHDSRPSLRAASAMT